MSLPGFSPHLGICLRTCILFKAPPQRRQGGQQFLVPCGWYPAAGQSLGQGSFYLRGAVAGRGDSLLRHHLMIFPGVGLLRDQGCDKSVAWEKIHTYTNALTHIHMCAHLYMCVYKYTTTIIHIKFILLEMICKCRSIRYSTRQRSLRFLQQFLIHRTGNPSVHLPYPC